MWRNVFSPLLYAGLTTLIAISSISIAAAQVMQSSHYRIQSDSVNIGGGLSSSTDYAIESTAGEAGTGISSSTNYALKAGYQQMQEIYLALSGGTNVSMTPSIPGVSGGTANGSTTITVITDSPSGYELSIASLQSPSMQKGPDSIADYAPSGSDPDFLFITNSADSHFGFTPQGIDIAGRFKDNGSACGTGTSDAALSCWDGLSASGQVIASSPFPNEPAGATTTINFRVGVGGTVLQAPGDYTATTTITALPL